MNFQFFVLLNAILLIRPEELYPEIEGFRFYMITIWACMLTTQNAIINQFTRKDLSRQPITVCVFGMFFAVTISLLCRNMIPFAVEVAPELFKVVLYYLLLIGVLNTPERFRMFLGWIVLFVIILTTYALLEFHGYIDIPSIQPIMQKMYDKEAGCEIWVPRLVSSGIYNDPNDMCLILTTGMVCCLARSTTASNIFMRVVWLLPIIMFAYAMKLTQSRGGMLGIIVALATLICFRLGPKRGRSWPSVWFLSSWPRWAAGKRSSAWMRAIHPRNECGSGCMVLKPCSRTLSTSPPGSVFASSSKNSASWLTILSFKHMLKRE